MTTTAAEQLGRFDLASVYAPWPKQSELHTSLSTKLLGIGGNGSGKSATLLGEALYVAFEFPGADSLLVRKNWKELEKGLILDLKNTLPASLYRYNDQKHTVTFPGNGSHIFFGHCKTGNERDLAQYLSSAFVFIGVDELGQFSYTAWDFLTSRNRINKGCKPNRNGDWPVPRMGGATNPMGPGYGWIKKVWIDQKPVPQMGECHKKGDVYVQELRGEEVVIYDPKDYHYVHSTVRDNPTQLEKDPLYMDKLMKLSPALRNKALYGDLNSMAGAYFSNFQRDRHVMSFDQAVGDDRLMEFQDWQSRWLGGDWGLAHYSAFYWCTIARFRWTKDSPWKEKKCVYRELVENEKGYDELCKMLTAATPEHERPMLKHFYLSPERFARDDQPGFDTTVAAKMGVLLRKAEMPMPERANDRRVDGAQFIWNLLETDELVIMDSCPNLINALEVVVRDDPDNLEDVKKTDSQEDDCYDGGRYAIVSPFKPRAKTKEAEYHETLEKITDPIAARMFSYQHHIKQQGHAKPGQLVKPRFRR